MTEYERSRHVQVGPDEVFAFVSDVRNMPTFVPTVRSAEPAAEGRVRIRGETRGHSYEDDGWFRVQPPRHSVEWGADGANYSGWLTVAGSDGGADVVAHLSFAPFVDATGRPISGERFEEPDAIEESLEAALDSLRDVLEGRGGKREPAIVG